MKTTIAFLTATYILTAPTASPEIGEKTAQIRNASWQAVPGTADKTEEYADPAFIDIKGISRNGDRVTFDVVNADASYGRIEGNCRTNQFRSLRFGHFMSSTQVSYIEYNEPSWSKPNSYQLKILIAACNTDNKK